MLKRPDAELKAHYLITAILSPLIGASHVRERLSDATLDWDAFMAQAHQGRVLPALYGAISAKNLADCLPEDIAEALAGFFDLNVQINARLRHQMKQVTACLNESDIAHVWIKGATHLLRPDWQRSGRSMLDLDIWVPNIELHALAFEKLTQIGYASSDPLRPLDLGRIHHYPPLYRDGECARLELHQILVARRCLNLLPSDSALEQVQWLEWEGQPVGILSPVDQALLAYIQCVHMSANQFLNGQVTLMKSLDFVHKALSAGSDVMHHERFLALSRSHWKARAEQFFTYLQVAYGLPSHLSHDRRYVRRLQYPLMASLEKSLDFGQRAYTSTINRELGPIAGIPKKLWRNLRHILGADMGET